MDETTKVIAAVLTAIIGVSIVSVLVSKNSQTSSVIQAATTGFSQILGVAVSPVTGNSTFTNLGNSSNLNSSLNSVSSLASSLSSFGL